MKVAVASAACPFRGNKLIHGRSNSFLRQLGRIALGTKLGDLLKIIPTQNSEGICEALRSSASTVTAFFERRVFMSLL